MIENIQYKNTSIGQIPKDWEVKKISDGTNYVDYRGKTPRKMDKGVLLLTARNIKIGFIDYDISNEYISHNDYAIVMRRGLPEIGDVLFTTEAPMGNVAQVNRTDIALAQRIIKFRAKPEIITNDYLKYYLLSEKFRELLDQKSTGGTAKGIKGSTLHKMTLIVPPLHEQQAITQLLSTWDTAIHKTEALLSQKELRKKWLMQQLLTGEKRLEGFDEEWKEKRIGNVTQKISRRNKQLSDAPIYSVTNSNGFVLQSDHFAGKVAGDDLSNYKVIQNKEFAYNPARINVGSLAYFEDEIGVISSLYVCFKTKSELLDYFLLQFLQIEHTKHRIRSLGEGGVRIYLWYDLFSKIKIKIPSIEEQIAIVQVLQTADKEIQLIKTKIEQLRAQKKGLMQQLLTGKKRMI